MDFYQKMLSYYQNESGHNGLKVIASVALLLLLGSFLSWKLAGPLSILKGLTIPLLVGGIFFGIAGAANGIYTKRIFAEKLQLYKHDKTAFFKEELPRVEKIHKSWLGVRIGWGLVALSGLGLLMFAKRHYLMGVGLGILIFGLLGQVVEAFSFHRNENYRNAVRDAAKSDQSDQHGNTVSDDPTGQPANLPVPEKIDEIPQKENRPDSLTEKPLTKDHRFSKISELSKKLQINLPDSINASGGYRILESVYTPIDSLVETGKRVQLRYDKN